jgi:hypothetical protein
MRPRKPRRRVGRGERRIAPPEGSSRTRPAHPAPLRFLRPVGRGSPRHSPPAQGRHVRPLCGFGGVLGGFCEPTIGAASPLARAARRRTDARERDQNVTQSSLRLARARRPAAGAPVSASREPHSQHCWRSRDVLGRNTPRSLRPWRQHRVNTQSRSSGRLSEEWRVLANRGGVRPVLAARPDAPPGGHPRAAPDPPPGRALHTHPRVGRRPRLSAPAMKT